MAQVAPAMEIHMAIRRLAAAWSAIDRDRRISAALLGGVALLLFELRFEHLEVLGETWRSWIPLIYSAVTLLAGLVALLRWDAGGRRVLALLFGAGIAVGLLGFWFHTDGHLLAGVRSVLGAWRVPLGQDGGIKMGSQPPALAPLAFCGLGTLGLLICLPGTNGSVGAPE
jgi:hypothetical protein